MKTKRYIILSLLAAIIAATAGYFTQGYWQALLINLSTTFLGLSIGLIVINHFLNRQEKRQAAIPMLEMIHPYVSELHNDHFIDPGRLKFGIPGFNALIDAYEQNGRTPAALSPEQRNGLYDLIKEHRLQATLLMDTIHDQLKEMTSLLGWSFSPRIITVSMRARLEIIKFKTLDFSDSDEAKLRACELYLDIDSICGGVLIEINSLLGLSVNQLTRN
jgi:hypothetical protein